MRYLSEEWKAEQWRVFKKTQIAGDTSDCGGWKWNPPCGGCARCMTQQFGYYLDKEIAAAQVFLRAGFDVANPSLVTLPDYTFPGKAARHDSWHCHTSDEREEWTFPWE